MVRTRRLDSVKVVFVGPLNVDNLVADLGALVPTPATAEQIVERAKQIFEQPDARTAPVR